MKIITRILAPLFLISILFYLMSCSGPDPVDAREITDATGLNIDLEWSTSGSIAQSLNDVDLDIRLFKGTTQVDNSLTYSFEQVELKNIYADGEYSLEIEVAAADVNADYTVYISGIETNTTKEYEGTITPSDNGVKIEFLTIRKTGTRYIINK